MLHSFCRVFRWVKWVDSLCSIRGVNPHGLPQNRSRVFPLPNIQIFPTNTNVLSLIIRIFVEIITMPNYLIALMFLFMLTIGATIGYYIRAIQYPLLDIQEIKRDAIGEYLYPINNEIANETIKYCEGLTNNPPSFYEKAYIAANLGFKHTRTVVCVACGSDKIASCTGHIHKGGGTAIASWCIKHEEGRGWSNHNVGTCKGCYGNREDLEIITD